MTQSMIIKIDDETKSFTIDIEYVNVKDLYPVLKLLTDSIENNTFHELVSEDEYDQPNDSDPTGFN